MIVWLLWFCTAVAAFAIEGYVSVGPANAAATTVRIEQLGGPLRSLQHLTPTGNFTFRGIEAGEYLLSASSPAFVFDYRYKLSVTQDGLQAAKVLYGHVLSDTGPAEDYPLAISGKRVRSIIPRPGFSFWALIKQPMVFMGIVTMLIMFGLPYITGLLDEDTLEEVRRVNAARAEGKSIVEIAKGVAEKNQ